MPASNLFSRMGGWFKPGGSTKISAADPAKLDEDGLLKPSQDASNRGGVSTLLSRWQERSQSLERLERHAPPRSPYIPNAGAGGPET